MRPLALLLLLGSAALCAGCAAPVPEGKPDASTPLTGLPVLQQTCAASTDPNACYKCEDEKCCRTYADCKASPECQAFKTCLQACPAGEYCEESCAKTHGAGLTAWAPRLVCMTVHCPQACSSAPVPDCVSCINANCAKEYAELESTPEGYLLQSCIAACTTPLEACIDTCKGKYRGAVPGLNVLAACSKEKCTGKC